MQRREFIINGCRACMVLTAFSGMAGLASCSPSYSVFKTDIVENQLRIPLNHFDKESFQVISPRKFSYEIGVQKNDDNTFKALLLRCTHQANQLTPTGKGYTCSLHGSTFDKQGNVTKGPAEQKLRELQTSISGNDLIIYL